MEGAMTETLSQFFLNTLKLYQKDDFMRYKESGKYVPISTQEFGNQVKNFALGLKDLGVEPGDKLIILSENCPNWVITDLANLCIGGITVPIYTSLVPEQIKYIIDNSDAGVVVCSDLELWKKIEAVKNELIKVKHFILLQPKAPEGVLTLSEIQDKGKRLDNEDPKLFDKLAMSVKPDDIASIIYTSGTTGTPKGVMLFHSNFVSNAKTISEIIEFSYKDTVLSFLPLSHVLERMVTFTYIYKGCSIAYAESVETIGENLVEIKPHIMVSVPRVFEKIYAKVIDNVLASSAVKRKIFFWAVGVGKECGRKKLLKQNISGLLKFKNNLAHKLVFSKVIEKTGGRVRFFVSGGAALSKDIAEFFYAMGLVVLEGYGLPETSPVIAVNTFDNLKFGSVGVPIPKIKVKIADDGEILSKGPHIMKGYYKMEAETREAIKDGWFYTGDIGYLDEEGFLVITDRKKDIIVTTGGKNVAPQMIESILKVDPFITSAVVVGDRRKFVSALIVPNFEKLEKYAKEKNISYSSHEDLVKNDKIISFFEEEIDKRLANLSSYEKVKKVILLEKDFEIEKGEVTPTLKIKRNYVEKKYKNQIDTLYKE